MLRAIAAAAFVLVISVADSAWAQRSPGGAQPGRERQQLFFDPVPAAPSIQLRDGRPAPVIEPSRSKRPVKRRKAPRR